VRVIVRSCDIPRRITFRGRILSSGNLRNEQVLCIRPEWDRAVWMVVRVANYVPNRQIECTSGMIDEKVSLYFGPFPWLHLFAQGTSSCSLCVDVGIPCFCMHRTALRIEGVVQFVHLSANLLCRAVEVLREGFYVKGGMRWDFGTTSCRPLQVPSRMGFFRCVLGPGVLQ